MNRSHHTNLLDPVQSGRSPPPQKPAAMDMSPEALRAYCKKNKMYLTEELNDKLYLHYKVRGGAGGPGPHRLQRAFVTVGAVGAAAHPGAEPSRRPGLGSGWRGWWGDGMDDEARPPSCASQMTAARVAKVLGAARTRGPPSSGRAGGAVFRSRAPHTPPR